MCSCWLAGGWGCVLVGWLEGEDVVEHVTFHTCSTGVMSGEHADHRNTLTLLAPRMCMILTIKSRVGPIGTIATARSRRSGDSHAISVDVRHAV